ncbi:hypothetical protein A0128_10450 [Leptospira tipperaryensis]|uniref:Cytochrome b5 heme-binding domain-containing protein n=1 Tax=Leptospira tipperaryensis TaxID=2564040 RepID=A0A1D7UXB9_9LEPT|nr:cytochrome b5 domain-containing protein [Leptospira tipperaryensis]AOP34228.1 hypothetical protein A0128_10450 [Leptospira tipperaryensis]
MVKYFVIFGVCLLSVLGEEKTISMEELRLHNTAVSCWILIEKSVYDVTEYITVHDSLRYDIRKWCGTDSTKAYSKKDQSGKSHSKKADLLLRKYKIGLYRLN